VNLELTCFPFSVPVHSTPSSLTGPLSFGLPSYTRLSFSRRVSHRYGNDARNDEEEESMGELSVQSSARRLLLFDESVG